jgi:hypothetical protein
VRARIAIVAFAVLAALAPVPAVVVERVYSRGMYPRWQAWITSASNAVPIPLFDVFVIAAIATWLVLTILDIRRNRWRGWSGTAIRLIMRTAMGLAIVYVFFLASWGLNYRRVPLVAKVDYDSGRVSTQGVRSLAEQTASRLNGLYAAAQGAGWPDASRIDAALAAALADAERELGAVRMAVPGRPKRTLLDWYFRKALVDGMTDPFFLETLVVSDLLPFERPFVTAHEWAHLAGYTNEGEANFVGWLSCMRGNAAHQYSGWLFLYGEAAGTLPRADRAELAKRLDPGPLADLRAASARATRNLNPRVSAAGWRVYNEYLKANRVESGTASYAEVVRLILGTKFNPVPPV